MCTIFLTTVVTEEVVEAQSVIKSALLARPDHVIEMNELFKKVKVVQISDENIDTAESCTGNREVDRDEVEHQVDCETSALGYEEPVVGDQKRVKRKTTSLKTGSPFAVYFNKVVERQLTAAQQATTVEPNPLYCSSIIEHLQEEYMPYYFLWGGVVLRGTGLSRVGNGSLENYQGVMKYKTKKNISPQEHIVKDFRVVRAACSDYLKSVNTVKKRKKVQVEDSEDSYSDDNDNGLNEKDKFHATEGWDKARRCSYAHLRQIAQNTQPLSKFQRDINADRLIPKILPKQCAKSSESTTLARTATISIAETNDPDIIDIPTQPKSRMVSIFKSQGRNVKADTDIDDETAVNVVGGITLTKGAYARLNNKSNSMTAWIPGDVIEAYVSLYQTGGFYLNVMETKLLYDEEYDELYKRITSIQYRRKTPFNQLAFMNSYVCGATCVDSHWTCFFADMLTREYIYLDPRGTKDNASYHSLLKWQ
jgi:hypothetical protein